MFGDEESTQAFWREFLKTDEAQEAIKETTHEEFDELRDRYERTQKPQELRELAEALMDSSRDVKKVVAPLLKYEFAQRMLYHILCECKRGGRDFSEHLSGRGILSQLEKLADEIRADPARGHAINDEWWRLMSSTVDAPVARATDVKMIAEAMNQAQMYCEMGNTKFEQGDVQTALDRYTMGVDTVCAIAEDDDPLVKQLRIRLLSNQAACALKTDRWKLCVEASDKVLADRSDDLKALYRKGTALFKRGDLDAATECLRSVLRFDASTVKTYEEAESVAEARAAASRQLRRLQARRRSNNSFKANMAKRAFVTKGLGTRPDSSPPSGGQRAMDPNLKVQVERRLREQRLRQQEDDVIGRSLSVCQILDIQRRIIRTYENADFLSVPRIEHADLRRIADNARQPILDSFGFSPQGHHALQRAIAAHLDVPQVKANADRAFDLLFRGADALGPEDLS